MNGNRGRNLWMVFRWPAMLAVVTGVGLASALLGNGFADVLSWLLLGSLLVVVSIAWTR